MTYTYTENQIHLCDMVYVLIDRQLYHLEVMEVVRVGGYVRGVYVNRSGLHNRDFVGDGSFFKEPWEVRHEIKKRISAYNEIVVQHCQ
jgi:hypothetical protein